MQAAYPPLRSKSISASFSSSTKSTDRPVPVSLPGVAAQPDQHECAVKISRRVQVAKHLILKIHSHLPVVLLVLEIKVGDFADGEIRHFNALEVHRARRRLELGGSHHVDNVRLAEIVLHHRKLADVQLDQFEVKFAMRQRFAVELDVQLADVEEWRAAKVRRVVEREVFDGGNGREKFCGELPYLHIHTGLRANLLLHS